VAKRQYIKGGSKSKARPKPPENAPDIFRALAKKVGGAVKMAEFLNCSRATAYNLMNGRQRWTHKYMHKAMQEVSALPVIEVNAECRAGFEISEQDWRPRRPQSLALDCDGAFIVKGNSMWPLVGDGQYVLYKNVTPDKLNTGDIVLARVRSGETLIKAWYPMETGEDQVFLASLYRGPDAFRKDLFKPFNMSEFEELRKVVGIWLS
jgi:hypothetical protein